MRGMRDQPESQDEARSPRDDARPWWQAKTEQGRSNQRANLRGGPNALITHGTRSPVLLAPLRAEALAWTHERWPWLDDVRRQLVADLAARVHRYEVWSDQNDIVVIRRDKRTTNVQPVVAEADRWQTRLWSLVNQLDAEARERRSMSPADALDRHVQTYYNGSAADG